MTAYVHYRSECRLVLQKEAATADRGSLSPSLGSCSMGGDPGDGFGSSPACAVLLLTLSRVGSGGVVQSRLLLPNSPALTRSLRDTKQTQLFYLESGERMCEIKVKNITLKSYFP